MTIIAVYCPNPGHPSLGGTAIDFYEMDAAPIPLRVHHVAVSRGQDPEARARREYVVDFEARVPERGTPACGYAASGMPPSYIRWPCDNPIQWAPSLLPCPCPRHHGRSSLKYRLPLEGRRVVELSATRFHDPPFERWAWKLDGHITRETLRPWAIG